MLIFIRQSNGNGFTLQVEPKDKIQKILHHLEQIYVQKQQKFQLFSKGKFIDNYQRTFLDLSINHNDIVHLIKNNTSVQKQQYLNINIFYNNDTYSFRISNKETVMKLKNKIYQTIKIHPKEQYLVLKGKKLQDSSTLQDETIQNNSLITLIYVEKKESFLKPIEHFPCSKDQLLESITSLKLKRTDSQRTKTSLFRSDSLGNKGIQEPTFPQIQVKYLRQYVDLAASIQSEIQLGKLLYNHQIPTSQQISSPKKQLSYIPFTTLQKGSLNLYNHKIYKLSEQINQDLSQKQSSQSQCDQQSLYKKLKLEQNSLFQSMQFKQIQTYHQCKLLQQNDQFINKQKEVSNVQGA